MPNADFIDFKRDLESAFWPRDFQSMWFVLNSKYKALDFHDDISDDIRIGEYKYIVQQLRKYMSNHQEEILNDCDSPEMMLDAIDYLLTKAGEYGNERKEIAYNFIRDDWLMELRNYVNMFLNRNSIEQEEEDE